MTPNRFWGTLPCLNSWTPTTSSTKQGLFCEYASFTCLCLNLTFITDLPTIKEFIREDYWVCGKHQHHNLPLSRYGFSFTQINLLAFLTIWLQQRINSTLTSEDMLAIFRAVAGNPVFKKFSLGTGYGRKEQNSDAIFDILSNNYTLQYIKYSPVEQLEKIVERNKKLLSQQRFKSVKPVLWTKLAYYLYR